MTKKRLTKHNCTTGKCKSYIETNKNITITKDGKRYNIINDSSLIFRTYDIDDCVFHSHGILNFKLCDYIITVMAQKKNYLIFLELKGQHKEIAFEQIYNTSNNIIESNTVGKDKYVRIIYNSIKRRKAKNKKTEVQGTFEKKVYKEFGLNNIKQTNIQLEEKISKIIA